MFHTMCGILYKTRVFPMKRNDDDAKPHPTQVILIMKKVMVFKITLNLAVHQLYYLLCAQGISE